MKKREMQPDRALTILNRQRVRPVDLRLLRRILETILLTVPGLVLKQGRGRRQASGQQSNNSCPGLKGYYLTVYLVAEAEMVRLNETHLHHAGSTDVITFDYAEPAQPTFLQGEIFVCVDEAQIQARRFRTTWQSELVRYAVHGVLHLCGFDDCTAPARRKMKAVESKCVTQLSREFSFAELARRV